MVTIYSNLTSAYPGLTGFIDPLHPKVTWSYFITIYHYKDTMCFYVGYQVVAVITRTIRQ